VIAPDVPHNPMEPFVVKDEYFVSIKLENRLPQMAEKLDSVILATVEH
jgi:hypothetical protein